MPEVVSEHRPVWKFDWLTPARCRLLLALALLLSFLGNLRYITHDCPIDLSGDEAQYWDWSRNLDLSYYSKGPLVAYIIRANCAVFGEHAWAVRLPALIFAAGTAVVTYLLTLKLFKSDRLALGTVLLNGLVPMFIAGGVLMTIDPPFFFCWAIATYFAALAIFDRRGWCWPAAGIFVGLGILAKYGMLLWIPTLLIALAVDRRSRPLLKTSGPWVAVIVALLFMTPMVIWNQRHGWVSFHHVAAQTGTSDLQSKVTFSLPEFLGTQIGVIGPTLAVLMVAAVVYGCKRAKESREMCFLLAIGLPFFLVNAVWSAVAKIQANWPAPAYFTLLILTAFFIATRLNDVKLWQPWKWWVYATVVLGVIATPILHNTHIIYPIARRFTHEARKFDPSARLKGWRELADAVTAARDELGDGTFVFADDYQTASELAFYLRGQPKTFYAGSYFTGDRQRRRSQFDMWPDRSLDIEKNPSIAGRNAVYVGWVNEDVYRAFERVEPFTDVVTHDGEVVRNIRYARCYGFKGMKQPTTPPKS